jgi:hypothetical protein
MKPTEDRYPAFEANQVLTSGHLNEMRAYLDEQERLTRADLIGIGIACGLEVRLDGARPAISLATGCGVTSQGYLIVEPEDVTLVAYRDYVLPPDLPYPVFEDCKLWELFPDGEDKTTALGEPAGFLDDKAVVLFLELNKQALRNCSPNNCDDKGAEVTAGVKRLLIARADLERIIAAGKELGEGLTSSDLETALLAELELPDLRLPRIDVPSTGPATSEDLYAALLAVFRSTKLASATGAALSAAWKAFKPSLQDAFAQDPFSGFAKRFGFLDEAPKTPEQVRFLQYYVDLFDDLLRAYDEFRWKGAALLCACCPPDGLFPRHLMLGLLHPEGAAHPRIFRQEFLPSAALGGCLEQSHELLQLFRRLVEMARAFTDAPSLPPRDDRARLDPQIRVTPSALGIQPLGERAIPYYYRQDGNPPLYELWSHQRTRRNRANQNLGYRFDEFKPPPPAFVKDPLRFDLEPHGFLRIEGHLGKKWPGVMSTLLLHKAQYRLPIEVIALRSGAYDEKQPVDLSRKQVCFQDLEALYDALREELLSALAEGLRFLYSAPIDGSKLPEGIPQHPVLKVHARNFRYPAGSVGAWFEKYLKLFQSRPYIDVDQDKIDANAVLQVYCVLFTGTEGLQAAQFPHAVSIYYFTKLAEILPDSLDALAYDNFENKYQDLLGLVRFFRTEAAGRVSADLQAFLPQEDLIDHFDSVLFECKLDPIRSVHAEFVRRLAELRKRQFLATFLKDHPGIQHKAGVPLGGTFVLVYHQDPEPVPVGIDKVAIVAERFRDLVASAPAAPAVPGAPVAAAVTTMMAATAADARASEVATGLRDAMQRIKSDATLLANADVQFMLDTLSSTTPLSKQEVPFRRVGTEASKIIAATVDALADGTVIADFYLPYLVACDCAGVQFVLPGLPPPVFTAQLGCTTPEGVAEVRIAAQGGVPPYNVKVDDEEFAPLGEALRLAPGDHQVRIRDSESKESDAQVVTVPPPLALGAPTFSCSEDGSTYTATFTISGGTPPYSVGGLTLAGDRHTTAAIASGTPGSLEVVDDHGCSAKSEFSHECEQPCTLPCDGIAWTRGHRFWLPDPDAGRPYTGVKFDKVAFVIEFPQGGTLDLSGDVQGILKVPAMSKFNKSFADVVEDWLDKINKLVAARTQDKSWVTLKYAPGQPGSLGVLAIEYFKCLKFDIRIDTSLRRGETVERLQAAYTPDGTVLVGPATDTRVTIPAFEGTEANKCKPDVPQRMLCKGPHDMALAIKKTLQGTTLNLSVKVGGTVQAVALLWEVQDTRAAIAEGPQARFDFLPGSQGTKLIRLTAFTKEGCVVIQEDSIDVNPG